MTDAKKLTDVDGKRGGWRTMFRRASEQDPVPTFKIVALGNRGSGKTVFLTAFARELSLAAENRRYFLQVEDRDQRQRLDEAYETLAGGNWPEPTEVGDFTTYRFEVKVNSATLNIPEHLFNVEWIDYGGEIIDVPNPGSSSDDQFRSHVRDANALFCLLDGDRLRSWVDGETSGSKYVHNDIRRLVRIAQEVSCSVHVLITKWDSFARPDDYLFPGEAGQLEMVRAALMNIPGFSDLRSRSMIGQTKRLIPTSAVGPGFVEVGPDDKARILPNANPRGSNLDVPFAAIVLDFLEGAADRLTPRDRGLLRMPGMRNLPGVADTLLTGTTSTLLRQISPESMLVAGALDLMRLQLKRSASSESPEELPAILLIQDMRQRLNAFEDHNPASVLGLPAWARRA